MSKAVTPRDAKVLFGETLGESFIGSLLLRPDLILRTLVSVRTLIAFGY